MRKGTMTREQAIALVGESEVDRLERENCEPTSRCQTDGDEAVEFSASIITKDTKGEDFTLVAYYYQDQESLDGPDGEGVEDLSNLDWEINGFEAI
jgi:hypothetical protein